LKDHVTIFFQNSLDHSEVIQKIMMRAAPLSAQMAAKHKHTVARRPFQPEEDALLLQILNTREFLNWDIVAQQFSGRTARQCRERWMNYLSPQVRTGAWTREEDERLVAQVSEHGRSWSILSRLFEGRSENDIKNRWYAHVQPEVVQEGGRLVLATAGSRFPERRKRRRVPVDVKGNARRLLEEAARANAPSVGGPKVESDFTALFGTEFAWGLEDTGFEWLD
jgi:hypothetical protein